MRKRGKGGLNREQIIMLSASGFVIMALTLTGVYVSKKADNNKGDGYSIDFGALEKNNEDVEEQPKDITDMNPASTESTENPGLTSNTKDTNIIIPEQTDLDADPDFAEIEDSGLLAEGPIVNEEPEGNQEQGPDDVAQIEQPVSEPVEKPVEKEPANQVSGGGIKAETLSFGSNSTLKWPIVGNVLLNYSMDKTIYFPTLDLYKYSPAIVIEAVEGTPVTAATNAIITDVYYDEEIGNAVKMNIGSGYELIYGQLDKIAVSKGEGIKAGEIVGYVAAPTKYYSIEGSNVYFELTKDGTPVNPLSILE